MILHFRLILILLLVSNNVKAQSITHLEPSSWWVGMKDPNVQLLIHGKNIADLMPTITYEGVKILKINKVENKNYMFLDLLINKNAKPGKIKIGFSNTSKSQNVNTVFELFERKPNSAMRKSFNNADVIYLITPDRFVNGDTSNDSNVNLAEKANRQFIDGRHGGDIQGMIDKLDYIKNLGLTAIWTMPLLENNQVDFTYHGYAISDFYKIDPRFGSNELYKKFVAEARFKNIKIIKDVVLNHCGSAHWWMKDLPSKDWINHQGTFKTTNHLHETQQDIHAAKVDLKNQTEGWFVPSMPDLNQSNVFMAKYLIQNTLWWIEYADLAGLRIDTYPYSDKKFLSDWSKRITEEYPNLNIVGEEMSTKPSMLAYWQKGKKNEDKYISHLPSLMDFPMQNAVSEALTAQESNSTDGLTKIYQTLADDILYPNPNNLVVFADNHDLNRFFTQVNYNVDLFKMGMVYFLTTRGIPQLYYGTEIAMKSPKKRSDGEIRADFPGGWLTDTVNVFNQNNLNEEQKDVYTFLQKILLWRKSASAIHDGKLVHFAPQDGIYSYFRFNKKEKYWIMFNKNSNKKNINLKNYQELLPENSKLFDVYLNTKISATNEIIIKPNGFLIIKVE